MKIPGLDDALKKLDKFDDMQPVLEEIRDNLVTLVDIQSQLLDIEKKKITAIDYKLELGPP